MRLDYAYYKEGSLNAAQRTEKAAGLTDIHLELAGGLRQFVNVVFQQYPAGLGFNAGTVGAPMVIGGSIRAGREQEVKTAMMHAISALVMRVSKTGPRDLTVSIGDVKASNAMEGGHVLPGPGEEAKWLAAVGPLLELTA